MNRISFGLLVTTCYIVLTVSSCGGNGGRVDAIVGSWEAITGEYEEIVFTKEREGRRFSAYLSGRLFVAGTWSLSGSDLIIELDTGEREVFRGVAIKDGVLRTADGRQQYQRIRTTQEQIAELVGRIKALPDLRFIDEGRAAYSWAVEDLPSLSITGRKLRADVVLTTDDYADVVDRASRIHSFLVAEGFSPSYHNITETANGFERGAIKVLVVTHSPSGTDPDSDEPVTIKGRTASLEVYVGKAD